MAKKSKSRNLTLSIVDDEGNMWGELEAPEKVFKSKATGFYAHGKLKDPLKEDNRYQVGCIFTLISKPKK